MFKYPIIKIFFATFVCIKVNICDTFRRPLFIRALNLDKNDKLNLMRSFNLIICVHSYQFEQKRKKI